MISHQPGGTSIMYLKTTMYKKCKDLKIKDSELP